MDDSMVSFVRRFKLGYNNGKNKWLILILILPSLRNTKIPFAKDDDDDDLVVEDLVHTLSESDGISEGECDFPVCDDSSPKKDEVLDDIISIPPRNGNDHFNAESSPIESMLNRDNVISSPKIDLLIEEFAGELALIALILTKIVKAILDPKICGSSTILLITLLSDYEAFYLVARYFEEKQ
ncbi:hypothetical protein Tco_1405684 [Tanacetum coccineum]